MTVRDRVAGPYLLLIVHDRLPCLRVLRHSSYVSLVGTVVAGLVEKTPDWLVRDLTQVYRQLNSRFLYISNLYVNAI